MKKTKDKEMIWLLYDTILPFLWKDKRESKKISSFLKRDAEDSPKALVTPIHHVCIYAHKHEHTLVTRTYITRPPYMKRKSPR
jgi:hypothetical protein